jgi:hypothetical protein
VALLSALHENLLSVSPSRSGVPAWLSITSSPDPPSWSTAVSWKKADIFAPTSYRPFLRGADAVVHSMGILLEADYKGVLQGKEPIISGLQRAFGTGKERSQNPLERKGGESIRGDGQLTYELMNRDSGNSTQTLLLVQRLTCLIKSHRPSSRSFFRKCPIFCIHLSRC